MKKGLAVFLVIGLVFSLTGVASAFSLSSVEVNGDFRIRAVIADDTIGGDYKKSYWQFRPRLNFKTQIDPNITLFARYSDQNNMGGNQYSTKGTMASFDQYGIRFKTNEWNLSMGRQYVQLGQGSILGIGADAAGVCNQFDGVIASTTMGALKTTFVGGKTTKTASLVSNQVTAWYGFDVSSQLDKNLSLGFAYAHSKPDVSGVKGQNTWAVNMTFTASPSFQINAEYAKSDKSYDNRAYFVGATYTWGKDSFSIQYNKVGINSVDPCNSAIGGWEYPIVGNGITNNYEGFSYTYKHKINKATTFNITLYSLKVPGISGRDNDMTTGIVWKF